MKFSYCFIFSAIAGLACATPTQTQSCTEDSINRTLSAAKRQSLFSALGLNSDVSFDDVRLAYKKVVCYYYSSQFTV